MKYLITILTCLLALPLAAQPGAQPRRTQDAPGSSASPYMRSNPGQSYGQAYRSGMPSGTPLSNGRLLYGPSTSQKGSTKMQAPDPRQYPSQYNKNSYSPSFSGYGESQPSVTRRVKSNTPDDSMSKQTPGTVDYPFSRNRYIRQAEEKGSTRSTRKPEGTTGKPSDTRILPPSSSKKPIMYSPDHGASAGSAATTGHTATIRRELNQSTDRLGEALEQGNYDMMDSEIESVKTNVGEMRTRLEGGDVSDKLRFSTVERTYTEGLQLLEEGRQTGEVSKLKLGHEKLQKANEQANEVE